MAREGKTKFEAYINDIVAKPFKELLQQENLKFSRWLEQEQLNYISRKKRKKN